jgi:hypothetical protein
MGTKCLMSASGHFSDLPRYSINIRKGDPEGTSTAGAEREPWDTIGHPLKNEHPCHYLGGRHTEVGP